MRLLLFLSLAMCYIGYSQGSPTKVNASNVFPQTGVMVYKHLDFDNEVDRDGSPYLLEKDSTLIIYTKNNQIFNFDRGNYNIMNDYVTTTVGIDSVFIFDNKNIDYFRLNGKFFKRYELEYGKVKYLSLLSKKNNNLEFLKGYYTKIVKGKVHALNKTKLSNDKYIIREKYFVKKKDEDIYEVKLREKNVLKILDKRKQAIQKFAKENNLSFKKENDVRKIFDYYITTL